MFFSGFLVNWGKIHMLWDLMFSKSLNKLQLSTFLEISLLRGKFAQLNCLLIAHSSWKPTLLFSFQVTGGSDFTTCNQKHLLWSACCVPHSSPEMRATEQNRAGRAHREHGGKEVSCPRCHSHGKGMFKQHRKALTLQLFLHWLQNFLPTIKNTCINLEMDVLLLITYRLIKTVLSYSFQGAN